ncbi:hypothetical protein [Algibacillus agarilyticus]|uniref:hypothetical protein n=1 Tax=Algibacillus agarilyticus TaxID=2234133 RepID=UPI000DD06323|nr:hypothetical protein [Algibacillus agarilyticus]
MSKPRLVFVMLACFIISNLVLPFSAAIQTQQAQAYQNDDLVLICTGNKIKWLSLSATQAQGHFVYVDAPTDAPSNLHQIDCSWGLLAEPAYQDTQQLQTTLQLVAYKALLLNHYQQPYTTFAYQTAESRAPPTFSV